jgi:hypothetical protein
MSYRPEALVAVLVSAEALLRDAGWPACRGQIAAPVRISVLAQVAGAVASAVDGRAPESSAPPTYWCRDPECWVRVGTPDTDCPRHLLGVWQRAQLRAGVFAVEQADE